MDGPLNLNLINLGGKNHHLEKKKKCPNYCIIVVVFSLQFSEGVSSVRDLSESGVKLNL